MNTTKKSDRASRRAARWLVMVLILGNVFLCTGCNLTQVLQGALQMLSGLTAKTSTPTTTTTTTTPTTTLPTTILPTTTTTVPGTTGVSINSQRVFGF